MRKLRSLEQVNLNSFEVSRILRVGREQAISADRRIDYSTEAGDQSNPPVAALGSLPLSSSGTSTLLEHIRSRVSVFLHRHLRVVRCLRSQGASAWRAVSGDPRFHFAHMSPDCGDFHSKAGRRIETSSEGRSP